MKNIYKNQIHRNHSVEPGEKIFDNAVEYTQHAYCHTCKEKITWRKVTIIEEEEEEVEDFASYMDRTAEENAIWDAEFQAYLQQASCETHDWEPAYPGETCPDCMDKEISMQERIGHYYLTAGKSGNPITDEDRKEVMEALREKLRQVAQNFYIGHVEYNEAGEVIGFERIDIDNLDRPVNHDVDPEANLVIIEVALEFDAVPFDLYCDDCKRFGHETGSPDCPWESQ